MMGFVMDSNRAIVARLLSCFTSVKTKGGNDDQAYRVVET